MFRFFGPTCDSLDAMQGPFELPAYTAEGDMIEIGMLGAYGTSISSNFNGFGTIEMAMVADAPWPSMFDQQPDRASGEDTVINLARARRRRPKLRRRA